MTSPNHIVGGVAITGISLSFYDINIFASASVLSCAIFASLLPDIDHTKSIIGKLFFPIATYLDKNFGHRTITHSLTFLIPCTLFVGFIENTFIQSDLVYTYVFFFGMLSHLILDMLTVQGIPLFYPFLRNPCVIPANPKFRIRSGNLKSESIAMALFVMVLSSSFDLYQNGFWTSYNRSFGTITHAFREFKSSENIVSAEYKYSFNGENFHSSGYIIDADEHSISFYDNTDFEPRIVNITKTDNRFKNIEILPVKTNFAYKVIDKTFLGLTIEQLNDSLKNKIVSGKIISTGEFKNAKNNISKNGVLTIEKNISPVFSWIKNNANQLEIQNKISIKKAELKEIANFNFRERKKLNDLKNGLFQLELNLKNSTDLYNKNKFEKLIIEKKEKLNKFTLNLKPTESIKSELKALQTLFNSSEEHFLTADLKIFQVPENDENFKLAEK